MYLDILNKIDDRYYRACYAAYNYDFDNLVANFNKEDFGAKFTDDYCYEEELIEEAKYCEENLKLGLLHELTYYIVRGVRFSFYFAWKLRHSDLELNHWIYRAISARFVMSNYLEDDFIKEYIPACLWFPNIPKKETCLRLLEIAPDYKYSIGCVAVLNDWNDVFFACDFEDVDEYLWKMVQTYQRKDMIDILKGKTEVKEFIRNDGRVKLDAPLLGNDTSKFTPRKNRSFYLEQFTLSYLIYYHSIRPESLLWSDIEVLGGTNWGGPDAYSDVTGIGYVHDRSIERMIHQNERTEELYM
ncbi:similar to Kazachstania africana KAFR_0K00130 hypothetical protein [Maudiozyma saulgeensis]|uniref:Uncharacterized protein n=1 Tax=Maudiozyma saulgeensis TaxID=1789683 RepID=A0A1X7RAR3_9SACH|nr:similar to Kazachstania africana KAFR_0K00130 hypothetical protein [Kazachstania saulgeensis]